MAIKQMSLAGIPPDNLAGIMGEIDLLKNLNHRNIVKYIGPGCSILLLWTCLKHCIACLPIQCPSMSC